MSALVRGPHGTVPLPGLVVVVIDVDVRPSSVIRSRAEFVSIGVQVLDVASVQRHRLHPCRRVRSRRPRRSVAFDVVGQHASLKRLGTAVMEYAVGLVDQRDRITRRGIGASSVRM